MQNVQVALILAVSTCYMSPFHMTRCIYKYRNMYHIYLATRKKGWGLVKVGGVGGRLLFQNNPKYLAPAYMIDLDFGDFFGKLKTPLNPIALRTAKTLLSFGLSECRRVKTK